MTDRPGAARWWIRLTDVTAALVAGACLAVLWAFLPPVRDEPLFGLAMSALAIVGALWLLVGLIGWFKYRSIGPTVVAPAFVLVTAALVVLSIPSTFAFAVSKGDMTAMAEECPNIDSTEPRVGLFRVWHNMPVDNGCFLSIRGGGLIDGIGYAYLPDGPVSVDRSGRPLNIEYRHHDGDWYEFVERRCTPEVKLSCR